MITELVARCRSNPHALAFVQDRQQTTYGQLLELTMGWAWQWRSQPCFVPGGIVAIQLHNSVEYAAAVMACFWLGAAVVPVNIHWRPEEVARNLNGLPIACLIANRPSLGLWSNGQVWKDVPMIAVEDLPSTPTKKEQDKLEVQLQRVQGNDNALLLMTSGSSGRAKIVVRSQAQLLANARQVHAELQWSEGDRILPVTPFFHANGFSNGLLLPLWSGAQIVLLRQFFPATLADLIARESVHIVIGSPVVFESLLRHDVQPEACKSLEYAISSGAALPAAVAEQFHRRWGISVRELFGTSETGTIAIGPRTSSHVEDGDTELGKEESIAGPPLPGVSVSILSKEGDPLPQGEIGAIAVRSPAVMKGYWTPEGIDQARLPDGFYITGDTGRLDEKGQVRLTGRSQRFLNIGGNKVSAGEVEQVLRSLPGVTRARVELEGTPPQLIATVWLSEAVTWKQPEVLSHCRGQLAEYKIPRRFIVETVQTTDLPDKHSIVVEPDLNVT